MNKKCSDRDGISAFERKDGRYEARALDTRRFGSDGKRKYKSFYGATKMSPRRREYISATLRVKTRLRRAFRR